jgi:hypothetical protein
MGLNISVYNQFSGLKDRDRPRDGDRIMTKHARCTIFHGKLILKNVASLNSMIVSTAISGTLEFILKIYSPHCE